MTPTKRFHLGDVLSITTDRLVSPRHIEGVYDILNWMTQDNLWTHQLPRAAEEYKPWLLRQHPALRDVVVPDFQSKDEVLSWLAGQVEHFGEYLDVEAIPADDHARKNPLTELEEMAPGKPILVVAPENPA